jgi:hypothetical protein
VRRLVRVRDRGIQRRPLVNVLGNVIRCYFGADVAPQADSMFVSGEQPYRFFHVDPRLLDADSASPPPGRGAIPVTERAR